MKIIKSGNARFTIIENGVIRMEWAENGRFIDEPTFFATREYKMSRKKVEVSWSENDGTLIVETPLITLEYTENGQKFSKENLKATLNINGKKVKWNPTKKNKNNLGGAVSTLDGCYGQMDVPEGLIARDGWHVVDDSKTYLLKDGWLCERDSKHVNDIYLFVYGSDYKGALKSFAKVSGKTPLPRKYTFGSWYSRWHPYTADDFRSIVREYKENDFPLDILVMDMDWHYQDWQTPEDDPHRTTYGFGHAGKNMGWTGYSWNKNLIPDPAALISDIKKEGIAITLNDHPADGVRSNEDCYGEFARLMGLDAEKGENIPFLCGDKKYMDAFFASALEPNEKMGIDFWWLDWQQDYVIPHVPGFKGQKVLPWLNVLYYNHSKKGGKRGASYSRFGGYGDHRHPMFFSGDTVSLWPALKFEIENTVASGNSMCFWWGHDIGGFSAPDGEKNGEMYARWVQYGITTAALKLHSCWDDRVDRRPWTWDETTCGAIREMFHLRSELIPTIYSLAYKSSRDDEPFHLPLYYEYPETEEAYNHNDEYLLGGKILCAPIYTPGENGISKREVWLPEGPWYNFFTGEKREGAFTEKCDIHSFPMYVKSGCPIPMQPYTQRMTSTPLTELRVRIYEPYDGCRESFSLYEDDGISEDYLTGEFLMTDITCARHGKKVSVTFTPKGKGYEGMVKERNIVLEIWQGGEKREICRTVTTTEKMKIEFETDK